jgi:histidinol dehydrogenase
MRILRKEDFPSLREMAAAFSSRPVDHEETREKVREILESVRNGGDEALIGLTRQLDAVDLAEAGLRVRDEEFEAAEKEVEGDFLAALRLASRNITAFHRRQMEDPWFRDTEEGLRVGQMVRPLERVGIYIPGGNAAYPSTALMSVIPAKVAGVRSIAVCSPPGSGGRMNPYLLYTLKYLKVNEVYRLGGAQAIAALAFGTASIHPVDMVAGPGNLYVSLAKLELYGQVGVDLFAGPSEVVVIADRHAPGDTLALDLLSQAEHGSGAKALLIAESERQLQEVRREIGRLAALLYEDAGTRKSIEDNCFGFVADSPEEALELANLLAPEHLEIHAEDFNRFLDGIKNAGTVMLGKDSPVCLGDYVAGSNHVLPTGGSARFASPLGVRDFLKRINVVYSNERANRKLLQAVEALASVEGLKAHALSLQRRCSHRPETGEPG